MTSTSPSGAPSIAHQPSARAFRPQTFAALKGQNAIRRAVTQSISLGNLPNAYLFSGTRGCGKTTLARLIAKTLNCLTPERNSEQATAIAIEPCGVCQSCLEMQSNTGLNCIEIDGASNRGIDDIRQIQENVSLTALSGGYKVYIIDEVHMLTKEAFNALLKTLEEPPKRVLFVLATTEPHKVPDTILSRCQCYSLKQIDPEQITEQISDIAAKRKLNISPETLKLIASLGRGSMRDSLSLFDQVIAFGGDQLKSDDIFRLLHLPSPTFYRELDFALTSPRRTHLFELAGKIFEEGLSPQSIYEGLAQHARNHLLVAEATISALQLPTQEEMNLYTKVLYPPSVSLELIEIAYEALKTSSIVSYGRLHLEISLLAMHSACRQLQKPSTDHHTPQPKSPLDSESLNRSEISSQPSQQAEDFIHESSETLVSAAPLASLQDQILPQDQLPAQKQHSPQAAAPKNSPPSEEASLQKQQPFQKQTVNRSVENQASPTTKKATQAKQTATDLEHDAHLPDVGVDPAAPEGNIAQKKAEEKEAPTSLGTQKEITTHAQNQMTPASVASKPTLDKPAKQPSKDAQKKAERPISSSGYDTLVQFTARELGGKIQRQ